MNRRSLTRRTLSIALALILAGLPCLALAAPEGTVYLKNGGRIHGEIMEVEPDEFVTVRLPDGSVRKIEWERVERVDDKPAPTPPPAPARPVSSEPAAPKATVFVKATKPSVTISEVTGRIHIATSNGSGQGIAYRPLCTAPCSFELTPGTYELVADGPGYTPTLEHVGLDAGLHQLTVNPGSFALRVLSYVTFAGGLTAVGLGAMAATGAIGQSHCSFTDPTCRITNASWGTPTIVVGSLAVVGSIVLYIVSRTTVVHQPGRGGRE